MPRLKAAPLLGRTATGARIAATADMVIGGGGGGAGAAGGVDGTTYRMKRCSERLPRDSALPRRHLMKRDSHSTNENSLS